MLNRITLVGRLTKDPESQYTPSGVEIAKFRIAVDRMFKNKETGEKETDFFDVVTFRQTAEFVGKYLTKGRLVSVDGRMQYRTWKAQDGSPRSTYEVNAENVHGLDRAPDGERPAYSGDAGGYGQQPKASPGPAAPAVAASDDDDPFADE